MILIMIAVIGYLLGSIPSGYLLGRGLRHRDIRQVGSGNSGTTNAFRTMGKAVGILTLICDFCKGILACWIAVKLLPDDLTALSLAAFSAVFGHCFSCFLSFDAGKGVATAAGVLTFIDPRIVGILLLIFAVIFLMRRIVSLASLSVAVSAPILFMVFGAERPIVIAVLLMALLIIYRHRANIGRLIEGTEASFKKRR